MIAIQDLGTQILGDNPKKLYILGGPEYGVKQKYIEHLSDFYKGNVIESEDFDSILEQMRQKHIVPLEPALYVVRYDTNFVSSVNDKYASKIEKSKISGTVVCLYEDDKAIAKFDKYLPDYTASIDNVNSKFINRYLHQDFPKLDDRSIKVAIESSTSYGHAKTICNAMSFADPECLARLSESDLAKMFGYFDTSSEQQIQIGVASKNFKMLVSGLEAFPDSEDKIVYIILQTMIELEKIKSSKYSDSPLKEYAKFWDIESIYYMFMHAYDQLRKLRSISSYSAIDSCIYLFSLLKFQPIPSLEVLSE